uniref:Rps4 n=1 Tax=Laurentiella strenua TaxID=114681 RepID=A0A2I4PET0_9SPIT|nr:rps4 [Laurentiella strenua]
MNLPVNLFFEKINIIAFLQFKCQNFLINFYNIFFFFYFFKFFVFYNNNLINFFVNTIFLPNLNNLNIKKNYNFTKLLFVKSLIRKKKYIFKNSLKKKNILIFKNILKKKINGFLFPKSKFYNIMLKSSILKSSVLIKNNFFLIGNFINKFINNANDHFIYQLAYKKIFNLPQPISTTNTLDLFEKKKFLNNFFYFTKVFFLSFEGTLLFNEALKKVKLPYNRYTDVKPFLIFGNSPLKKNIIQTKTILETLLLFNKMSSLFNFVLRKKKKLIKKFGVNINTDIFNSRQSLKKYDNFFYIYRRKEYVLIKNSVFSFFKKYKTINYNNLYKNVKKNETDLFFDDNVKTLSNKFSILNFSNLTRFRVINKKYTSLKILTFLKYLRYLLYTNFNHKKKYFLNYPISIFKKSRYFFRTQMMFKNPYKNLRKIFFLKKNLIKIKKSAFLFHNNFFRKKSFLSINKKKNYFIVLKKKTPFFFTFTLKKKTPFFFTLVKNNNFANHFSMITYSRPILCSRVDFSFFHSFEGFLFLNDKSDLSYLKAELVYSLRKLIYSFSFKNDLQNYILKKYVKTFYASTSIKNTTPEPLRDYLLFDQDLLEFPSNISLQNLFTTTNYATNNYASFDFLKNMSKHRFSALTDKIPIADWLDTLSDKPFLDSLFAPDVTFTIKKIKFKPGYSIIWREAREVFKTSLNLKFRYQKKLTTYLLKFNKIIRNKIYFLFEMQLGNILFNSRLVPDFNWSNLFLENGLVFVNGNGCFNPYTQLYKGDFVQLVVHLKYYIFYRWLLTWMIFKKLRLKNKIAHKLNNLNLPDDKQRSSTLPLWILTNKNFNEDISKYLEIDYFTLSFFILYEPILIDEINPFNFVQLKFNVINLFNWKYIN